MKRLCVHDRVMMSHDASTSGISRVLTVASLQRLKMEALIPAPADCEMRSVIKFLNAQSTGPMKIHRQLCQVYGDTRLDGQHISSIHPTARTLRPVIFIFSYTSRNSCLVSVLRMKAEMSVNAYSTIFEHVAKIGTTNTRYP